MCFAPRRRALFRTYANFQKCVRTCCALYISTWKCGLRPNGVALFRHAQLPKVVRTWSVLTLLIHFNLETRFAPQRRALFSHILTFKKWSETWCVLCILTWTCASRDNGVHFFDISTSKSGARCECVFVLFLPPNVLRATTACNFSFLIYR